MCQRKIFVVVVVVAAAAGEQCFDNVCFER